MTTCHTGASMTLVGLLPPICDSGSMLVDGGYCEFSRVQKTRSLTNTFEYQWTIFRYVSSSFCQVATQQGEGLDHDVNGRERGRRIGRRLGER